MIIWPKDTALGLPILMIDAADHVSGKTGLSPQAVISKNAGTFVTTVVDITSLGLGLYKFSLTAGMVDTAGIMTIHAYATSADISDVQVQVVDVANTLIGVRTNSIASSAISGGVFTTDAITGNVLAASAIDKIQASLATSTQLSNISAVVNAISQTLSTISGVANTISGTLSTISGVVNTASGTLSTISGVVDDIAVQLSGVSAVVQDTQDLVATFSGKLDTIETKVGTVSAVVDDIKVKTDQLTFSVSGSLDANIEHVNDVEITGVGTTGTPFGPV